MRNEKELSNDVRDRHAFNASERMRTNGSSQRTLQVSQDFPQQSDTLWERFKRVIPTPEDLTVAGRQVSGLVIPHWAAGVLLAAVLGSMGFMYSRLSDQRDMLIRLDTQLQERDKHEIEYRSEFKNQLNVQKVYIDNMTTQLATIKTLLTPQQMRTLQSRKVENDHAPTQSQ